MLTKPLLNKTKQLSVFVVMTVVHEMTFKKQSQNKNTIFST